MNLEHLDVKIPRKTGDTEKDIDAILVALHDIVKATNLRGLFVDLAVTGNASFFDGVSISGTLALATNLNVGGNLQVAGTTTLSGNVALPTNLFVAGTSTLSGTAVLSTNLAVRGQTSLSGSVFLNTSLAVGTTSTLSGAVAMKTALLVEGTSTLSGTAVLQSLLDLKSGQIQFPATQNASAGANVLDDYEEGTWTPTFAGSATTGANTYDVQAGRYTKIGRMVAVEAFLDTNTKDTTISGNMLLAGLPFTVTNAGQGMGIGFHSNWDLTAGNTQLGLYGNGAANFNLSQSGDNIAATNLQAAAYSNTSIVLMSGIYFTT